MTASFYTFGCKLNQYETEALASEFRNQGFSLTTPDQPADVYVINTCTVTSKSEQKARRLIRKISREHAGSLLVVTGCYAQLNAEDLERLGANVQVVPQEQKAALLELPRMLRERGSSAGAGSGGSGTDLLAERGRKPGHPDPALSDPFRFRVDRFTYHSRAFLKVQDGCDYRCSYCRVPLARGRSISLDPDEALQRAQELERQGYREVVLTGVNLTAYRFGPTELPELLGKILHGTEKLRVRLSSLEPERIKGDLVEALRSPRVRPHFHLPIQSGSDPVLLRMRRRYRSERIIRAVEMLRSVKEDPFLAADMMVGFPGEGEQDFQASLRLVETLGLSKLHVFPFSPRSGTAAEHWSHPVPERIRDQRVHRLLALSGKLHETYIRRWQGSTVEVVLEGNESPGAGSWRSLSENYLKILVDGVPQEEGRAGNLVEVSIREAGDPCRGRFVGTAERHRVDSPRKFTEG
jgi:threonylcarbamoyladenosine tRNA methylthiotransferase MtaB